MRGDLFIGVTATGTVEPVEIIDVGAQIVGSIKSFGPDPDQPGKTIDYRSRVKKGAVLAQLDDLPHEAELDKAQVDCQARRSRAQTLVAPSRNRRNAPSTAPSSCATRIPRPNMKRPRPTIDMAEAEVAMAEAKLDQAKIARQQAEINLELHHHHARRSTAS